MRYNARYIRGRCGLLIPELRKRGLYPNPEHLDGLTAREKIYGKGQSGLRDDHPGSKYKYEVYVEDPPSVSSKNGNDTKHES